MKNFLWRCGVLAWVLGLVVVLAPVKTEAAGDAYQFVSENGYSILCPQKPMLVIPAGELYRDRVGDVLVFDREANNLKHAWIIVKDGFEDSELPNLNLATESELQPTLEKIQRTVGYESIKLIKITEWNHGVYAVTAKDVEIDTDGDGVPDRVGHSDTQMAVTFFRGNKGGRYRMELLDNPDLRDSSIKDYQYSLITFQELDEKELKDALKKAKKKK
ncbi:MAG: hypothetical protein IJ849_04935 [Selenomonadaceae bacterium]|nr:hypothetical protein [Selenomonadaceae bacterium]